MRAICVSASCKLAFSFDSHSFVVVDVESSPEDVVEVFNDDLAAGKKISNRSRELQNYKPEDF